MSRIRHSMLGLRATGICLLACIGMMITFAQQANAEVSNYPFDSDVQEKRFLALLAELRCPKCQNQSLADSDADIAKDLRQRVYDLLNDNKSDEEIRNYLIDRYGDFVSYRPPFKLSTAVLWLGPFVVLFISLALAFRLVLRNSNT